MIQCLNPASIAAPFARYSHGVRVSGDVQLIATSGQLGVRKDGSIPESAGEQAVQCFRNIDAILAEAGSQSMDVVRINAYVTDRIYMQEYMQARDAWLENAEQLPASTLMIVSGFTRPEFVVEVEVLAAVRA